MPLEDSLPTCTWRRGFPPGYKSTLTLQMGLPTTKESFLLVPQSKMRVVNLISNTFSSTSLKQPKPQKGCFSNSNSNSRIVEWDKQLTTIVRIKPTNFLFEHSILLLQHKRQLQFNCDKRLSNTEKKHQCPGLQLPFNGLSLPQFELLYPYKQPRFHSFSPKYWTSCRVDYYSIHCQLLVYLYLTEAPTVDTQYTDTVLQRQNSVNMANVSLLALIQNYNATLLGSNPIQHPQLHLASQRRYSQPENSPRPGQCNHIPNTSLTNNMSGIQMSINTLQNQVLTATSTLNDSQVQVQGIQSKITQDYIQINTIQSKISQANNSLQDALNKQNQTWVAINYSKTLILSITQNITSLQTNIVNAPIYLAKLQDSLMSQKSVILSLQKQLQDAILAHVPIQNQVDYYSMIPLTGPGQIQNKTILVSENSKLHQYQPTYDSSSNDISTYSSLLDQLTAAMNSLQNQLSADKLSYNNLVGSQTNQQGLFNNTIATISTQTTILNKAKQQQQDLLTDSYNAALRVASDTENKVNQLASQPVTQTLNSLNQKYQSVQRTRLQPIKLQVIPSSRKSWQTRQSVNQAISNNGGVSGSKFNLDLNNAIANTLLDPGSNCVF